jgi:hypothetical protein
VVDSGDDGTTVLGWEDIRDMGSQVGVGDRRKILVSSSVFK